MIKSFRRLTAVLADSACCHLINFINWRLPGRTNSPADLAIRSRLRRHLIEPGISRQHAHLSCPFNQKPLVDPRRIHLLAGEFDQIVPVKTLQRLAETWNVQNLEIVSQGHFGYVAMNRVLRRLKVLG